jgi:hypothetical protein
MPTKTSAGPNEVVRLEVLRLAPPLAREGGGARGGGGGARGAGGGAHVRACVRACGHARTV